MIKIIYEDNHILVVEKPINIPVQEDATKDSDLLNVLKAYLKEKYNKPGNVYLGLVHRLDRPVGGIMIFAKTSKSAKRLNEQIKNNQIKKTYFAVICGSPKEKDTLKDFIKKDSKTNTSYIDKNGKYCELDYEKITEKENKSLVKINLITGRSHQIRVQFSNRGYPLYGDQKYNKFAKKGEQIALFAEKLEFIHPVSKENMEFSLPLPDLYPWNIFK